MISKRTFSLLGATVVCLLLLAAGCVPAAEEIVEPGIRLEKQVPEPEASLPKPEVAVPAPKAVIPEVVTLALKFTEQDSTTYKMTTRAENSVEFEGSLPKRTTARGGCTGNEVEMIFTEQIQSIDAKGNAVAKITIEGLKYFSKRKDKPILDFDSSREEDSNSPLAKLIGQSYTVRITPAGGVVEVIDVGQIKDAVSGESTAGKVALGLVAPKVIKRRHSIVVLPGTGNNRLRTGDDWSSVKRVSFGRMGSSSYEKIYTLRGIEEHNNQLTAVVEMSAIPGSESEEHQEQSASVLSKMFDNTETYTGQLRLDLTSGKVEKYFEKLRSEWVVVEPESEAEEDKAPAAIKMSSIRFYSLERID